MKCYWRKNKMSNVYDMTGKMATHITATEPRVSISVPHGVYNVRVLSSEGNANVKAGVK